MSQGRGNIEHETKREKMDFCLRETPRFEFKSTRICEALFDVAKCQRKRCRIERYPRKATWKREIRREKS